MDLPKRWGNPEGDPEDLDTTPVAMPLGASAPTPIHQLIATMVHQALAQEKDDGHETFEEANDFEEELEPGLLDMSPYTLMDMDEEYEPADEPDPEPSQTVSQPVTPTGDQPDQNAQEPAQP